MATSKAVEKAAPQEVGQALSNDEIQALLDQQDAEFAGDTYQTPILKVCQSLTAEVKSGDAEPGEFLNTLTGDSLGNEVDLIIAYYRKGRTARDRETGQYFVGPFDTIPAWWSDLHIDNRTTVGDAGFVGSPFSEFPEAEEQYKKRVNAKEHPWGKGPIVSTSYNYIGLVLVPAIEGDPDDQDRLEPVQLSLQRSNKSAADKIGTIKRAQLRQKPFWENVFHLSTVERSFKGGESYVVQVKLDRPTTNAEREQAMQLALAAQGGRTVANETGDPDATVEPEAKGGADF
jgi:hypothetical protein